MEAKLNVENAGPNMDRLLALKDGQALYLVTIGKEYSSGAWVYSNHSKEEAVKKFNLLRSTAPDISEYGEAFLEEMTRKDIDGQEGFDCLVLDAFSYGLSDGELIDKVNLLKEEFHLGARI